MNLLREGRGICSTRALVLGSPAQPQSSSSKEKQPKKDVQGGKSLQTGFSSLVLSDQSIIKVGKVLQDHQIQPWTNPTSNPCWEVPPPLIFWVVQRELFRIIPAWFPLFHCLWFNFWLFFLGKPKCGMVNSLQKPGKGKNPSQAKGAEEQFLLGKNHNFGIIFLADVCPSRITEVWTRGSEVEQESLVQCTQN